eukprot:TRINITY_DN30804_c0_g1_i1.p1 TRINITY_DN30804_c0_g1~~TRINITY_DN30804_c0_g1_i1.p1  ORF type:complete len:399 (-),score=73.84 TRINITY_DN30804_c0_g1_i1:115-1311(-)
MGRLAESCTLLLAYLPVVLGLQLTGGSLQAQNSTAPSDVTKILNRECVITQAARHEKNEKLQRHIQQLLGHLSPAQRKALGMPEHLQRPPPCAALPGEKTKSLSALVANVFVAEDRRDGLRVQLTTSWENMWGLTAHAADKDVHREITDLEAFIENARECMYSMSFFMHEADMSVIEECKARNAPLGDAIADRMTIELNQCSSDEAVGMLSGCDDEKCAERAEGMCPEGTACQCGVEISKTAAAIGFGGGYLAVSITKMSIGFLLFGPVGAAGAAAMPGDAFVAAGISAAVQRIPSCACTIQPCEEVDGACEIVPKLGFAGKNKYVWMPLPGFKCERQADASCGLSMCNHDDLASRRVGRFNASTYACDSALTAPTLSAGVPNSAEARAEHYENRMNR